MVSAVQHPQALSHSRNRPGPLSFPFAPQPSPPKSSFSTKPADSTSPLSPSFTDVTVTDDETNISGQDGFYLEKYSSRSRNAGKRPLKNGRSPRSRTRARPELNIVTHLPTTQARACDPDVTVEHVGARRTAAKIRPKSVVSSKAEHFDTSVLLERTKAFASIKNLAQARRERKQNQRGEWEQIPNEPGPKPEHPVASSRKRTSRKHDGSGAVVIGISIPETEAAVHQSHADLSAVTLDTPTPTTPAIVVTPAAAEYPQDTRRLLTPEAHAAGARPVSSVYSNFAFSKNKNGVDEGAPPVPVLPHIHGHSRRRASIVEAVTQPYPQQAARKSRRFSTGSGEGILQTAPEPSRHKSQGWWNLALSPMLSRAGTLKSQKLRDLSSSPDAPPVPDIALKGRARSGTDGSQISPETPRRLGLAGIRASIWSHWTTEHKGSRDVRASVNTTYPERGDQHRDDDLFDCEAQEPLPQELPFQDSMAKFQPGIVGGLADEYYHACAIEQLSGQPYFDCLNHSCSQGWPQFQSIFDKDGENFQNTSADTTSRSTQDGSSNSRAAGVAAAGAVGAAAAMHQRTTSNDSESVVVSPNVRQADAASFVQARAVENKTPPIGQDAAVVKRIESIRLVEQADRVAAPLPAPVPTLTSRSPSVGELQTTQGQQHTTKYPNIAAIVPPPAEDPVSKAKVLSPGPVSPQMLQIMSSRGAVPMTEMRSVDHQVTVPHPVVHNYYGYMPMEEAKPAAAAASIKPSPQVDESPMARDPVADQGKARKPGLVQRIKSWVATRRAAKEPGSSEGEKSRKARCIATLICIALLMVIAGSILLALLLTRHGDQTPTQTQWLNLTGYPPMPTGISTIIRPDVVVQQSQCVQPATAWSCSLPPENQNEVAPNNPDQPNFRFEIKFRNGTVASNLTIPVATISRRKRASDPFTNALFDPSPAPPPRAEQIFLGNTTDNITEPFEGEDTPFYMSFVPAFPINPSDMEPNANTELNNGTARLAVRQQPTDDQLASLIPAPQIDSSGLAAPANLLPISPFPTSQPIRFYNRGLPDEHFGFYIYYDRSIFLTTSVNTTTTSPNSTTTIITPADPNTSDGSSSDFLGGSARSSAQSRCTFSQTRFLVQIFTSPSFPGLLTGPVPPVGSKDAPNSATNYTPPGSFPYPTTITLDRHGGNVNKKATYCYGIDAQQRIASGEKSFLLEFRGVGGSIVNPAPDLLLDAQESESGGTGGCKCAWQNWS